MKALSACFCLNKHLDASEKNVIGVKRVYLEYFKDGCFFQKKSETVNCRFLLE